MSDKKNNDLHRDGNGALTDDLHRYGAYNNKENSIIGSKKNSNNAIANEMTMIGPALPPSQSTTLPQQQQLQQHPQLPPGTPESLSILTVPRSPHFNLRHVTRVSKRAALATKKQIWDSNDASIVAAQSAVDQWEQGYNALRGLLVASTHSVQGLYGAAKAGVNGLEHGFLRPVRDWVLLPAFGGVEKVCNETVGFLQSEHAERVAHHGLDLVKQVPYIGENVLAPAVCISVDVLKQSWQIAQYPIPSPRQVHDSVDFVMTGTKWMLSTTGREMYLYIKRADANITRTLSHTQWKVLGSGPYATLDKLNKQEVIDHLCERYFSLSEDVARYELAAHIRAHNRPLYHDLVLTGMLRERGGELTTEDEWLSSHPIYRTKLEESPFLLPKVDEKHDSDAHDATAENHDSHDINTDRNAQNNETNKPSSPGRDAGKVFPLWFRLPYENGKRPARDVPWQRFNGHERKKLESHYHAVLGKLSGKEEMLPPRYAGDDVHYPIDDNLSAQNRQSSTDYPTIATWYIPDLENDLLVDEKRYSVTFSPCCPKCRRRHDQFQPPMAATQFGELCTTCSHRGTVDAPWVDSLLSAPPVTAVMRPNMWRFHGPGDEVRRAVWFLDTQRHGLQPYGEDAQSVLEDAYLFLKWSLQKRKLDGDILLTVQVPSPDGSEHQLVQFSSLTSATAIGKGLHGAIALFKRRVYRGACRPTPTEDGILGGNNGDEREIGSEIDLSTSIDPSRQAEEFALIDREPTKEKATTTSADSAFAEEESHSQMVPHDPELELRLGLHTTSSQISELQESVSRSINDELFEHTIEGVEMDSTEEGILEAEETESTTDNDAKDPCANMEDATPQLMEPLETSFMLAFPFDESDDRADSTVVDNSDHVDHLVLVVHGIGEMLQAIDLFGLSKLSTIVDCCRFLRENHADVMDVRVSQLYEAFDGVSKSGRVDYLPVEWHEAFTIHSQRRRTTDSPFGLRQQRPPTLRPANVMIGDISLRTIPQMRQFANDTLMDVLYFMSPEHHDIITDIVVREMNCVVRKFRSLTGYQGNVSLIGHSLGSIISWDILKNQVPKTSLSTKTHTRKDTDEVPVVDSMDEETYFDASPAAEDVAATVSDRDADDPEFTSSNPSEHHPPLSQAEESIPESTASNKDSQQMPKPAYPQLSFIVDSAFMLGSPIAVFLMIRNQRNPLSKDFRLSGCSRVFNIFHPYDPVVRARFQHISFFIGCFCVS